MSLSKILRFSFDDPSSITSLGITLMLMLIGFVYYYFYYSSIPEVFLGLSTSLYKNFIDRLFNDLTKKGVCTFKSISDDRFRYIEDSKIYIIVFSKKYASSPRCLDQLVTIMECHRMRGRTAYAVFYDVKRTEVIDQKGDFGVYFSALKQEESFGKWKGALKEAGDLYGWELELNLNTVDEDQAKLIKEIVQKISRELFAYKHPKLNKLVEPLFAVKVDLTPGSAFSSIIWCLLVFAGLKSQIVTGFPFKTHPNAIMATVNSLLIYAFASMAELVVYVAGLDRAFVNAFIARLGRIISLCLFVTSLAILICI